MLFSLRQMEIFAAIARLGVVSDAALELALSQSAASTALAELERRAGQPLFDRLGKRLRLNETGRALLPRARDLLDRASEIDALLRGDTGPQALQFGATLTIGEYLGPLLIERYKQLYPGARIGLTVENTRTVIERAAHFDLDLALIEGESNHPRLIAEPWRADELAVFCAPSHLLAGQGAAQLETLLQQDWTMREAGSGTRQTVQRAFAGQWSRVRIDTELTHTEAIKRQVAGGRVISCLSRLTLADEFAAGRLVEIPAPDLDLRRTFYILMNRDKYRSAAIRAFLDVCRQFKG